jgi:hypothetical protein
MNEQAIWVSSDMELDGQTYVVAVHFTDDLSVSLTAEECAEYAATVTRAAGAATYDAAVARQLTEKLNMPVHLAGEVVVRMRKRRGQEVWTTPGDLHLVPGVSALTGQAFLKCEVGGDQLRWQWTPAEAEQHAGHVLQVVGAAEDDTHYLAVLKELEIETPRARAVVEDILSFR